MSRFLLISVLLLSQGCVSRDTPKLVDFHFLIGKWHSVGTDLIEDWSLSNDSLLSKSCITKNDSIVELDRSCIVQKGKMIYLYSHIAAVNKSANTYVLTYDSNEDKWVFRNDKVFPQVIYYENRKDDSTIYSFAINNKDKLEFLFEKVN
jgi:hypothetical protein